jgi:hypothetical protein
LHEIRGTTTHHHHHHRRVKHGTQQLQSDSLTRRNCELRVALSLSTPCGGAIADPREKRKRPAPVIAKR